VPLCPSARLPPLGRDRPERRSRTAPRNLAKSARLWSAPAERSGDGALAWLAGAAAEAKAGSRFACPRTPKFLRGITGSWVGRLPRYDKSRLAGISSDGRQGSLSFGEKAGMRGTRAYRARRAATALFPMG
jgi:hypothetical protein